MKILVFASCTDDEVMKCGETMEKYIDKDTDRYIYRMAFGKLSVYDNSENMRNTSIFTFMRMVVA